MSSLKTALFVLTACLAVVNYAMDTSNFTCVGNPYFTASYNPNATTPGTTDPSQLSKWNVTFTTSPTTMDCLLANN